jgi:hypothetical protein
MQWRRYYLLVLVFVSPFFAVANAYGAGLTDFDMSSIYGTVGLEESAPASDLPTQTACDLFDTPAANTWHDGCAVVSMYDQRRLPGQKEPCECLCRSETAAVMLM